MTIATEAWFRGHPFHDFRADRPEATHLCGEDRYRVSYEFGEDTWLSRWGVKGPAKDYVMTTRYRRLSEQTVPTDTPDGHNMRI
jgi:hypothetical protein